MSARLNLQLLLMLWLLAATADAGVNQWTPLGTGLTGTVHLVWAPAGQASRLLAGTDDGVWGSEDGGNSWRLLGLSGRSVTALTLDQSAAPRWYAGTGDGVYVSRDGGQSWARGAGLEASVFALAAGQYPDTLVYAGTFGRGVAWTADGGRTWSAGGDSLASDIVFALATRRQEPGVVYAGTGRGLFVSRDRARQWQSLGAQLRGRSVRAVCLPAAAGQSGIVVAATFGQGVFTSGDGGASWEARNGGLGDLAVRSLALDAGVSDIAWVATSTAGFWRTSDGGRSWQAFNQGLPGPNARWVAVLADTSRTAIGAGPGQGAWSIRLAPQPQLVVSREAVDFGAVTVGASLTRTVTVTNGGNAALTLASLTVEGSASFSASPNHQVLRAGERLDVQVRFAPASRGAKVGNLVLVSDDTDEPRLEIAVRGTGVQGELAAQPARVHFGAVRLGGYRDTTVVVSNIGNAAVSVADAYTTDTSFRVTAFQPRPLQPGQRCVVPVRFVPGSARGVSARLVVVLADQSVLLQVDLDGVGTAPDLAWRPGALDFGTVDPGQRQSLTLELANHGNAPLQVQAAEVVGVAFWSDSLAPFVVPAGETQLLTVHFLPLTSGPYQGELQLRTDGLGEQGLVRVTLTGAGGGLALVPLPAIPVATGAADLLAGDWNRDGRADLAVADSATGQVRVLLGDGAGGFASTASYPGTSSVYGLWDEPVALATAPLLSRYPDLVVADRQGRLLSILENDGTGRFDHRRRDVYIGHRVADVLAADLDADGDADIVVANGDTTVLTLLYNDGKGGFNARATLSVPVGPTALAAATLDGDGHLDLVVASGASGTVSVLLNDRAGGFAPRRDLVAGADPGAVAVVDVDADGDNDIVVANRGSWDIVVFANTPAADGVAFAPVQRLRAGMPLTDLALSDLTADVYSDLVATGTGPASLSFYENDGGQTYVRRDTLVTDEPLTHVCLADLNTDGANDLAVLSATRLRILLNQDARRLDPPRPPAAVAARDVGRDLGRQIEVSWQAPELDEQLGRTTEYVLYRSRHRAGDYGAMDTLAAGLRRAVDATATLADTFFYYLTAGNAALHSAPSDTVWAVSRPSPFFELQLVDEPRINLGDTLKVRAYVTPADHRLAGVSLYLTFSDSALALVPADTTARIRPFRLAGSLAGATVLQNQLHPRSRNRIDLSLANLNLPPGVEPILLGELWFSTGRDTVATIGIDDEPAANRTSAVVEALTGDYLLPFIPREPLQVAARDYRVQGQVVLQGRGPASRPTPFSLFLVGARNDTLRSPLNDVDRLQPGIQGVLDGSGAFRLDQVPPGRYQALVKTPTHLQGRLVADTVTVGTQTRTTLAFAWVGSDSTVHAELPAGDANNDNRINLADFGVLVRHYGRTAADPVNWVQAQAADFDGDGRVAPDDLFLLADHFGEFGMGLPVTARPAPLAGDLSRDGGQLTVAGDAAVTGFSLLLAGTQPVRISLAGSLWGTRDLMVEQWPEGPGRRVVAALRDPGVPAVASGVLVECVGVDGVTRTVLAAEVLAADDGVVPVAWAAARPTTTALWASYPNPFNPTTAIPYAVAATRAEPQGVRLAVYNALGQQVRLLVDGPVPAGVHVAVWDGLDDQGRPAASGVYLCRLEAGLFRQTRRLALVR
jgi:hypothetical protein